MQDPIGSDFDTFDPDASHKNLVWRFLPHIIFHIAGPMVKSITFVSRLFLMEQMGHSPSASKASFTELYIVFPSTLYLPYVYSFFDKLSLIKSLISLAFSLIRSLLFLDTSILESHLDASSYL